MAEQREVAQEPMKPKFEAIQDALSRTYISYASDDCCVGEVTSTDGETQYRVGLILDGEGDLHGWCDPRCGWWTGRKTYCKHLYALIAKWHSLLAEVHSDEPSS